MVPKRWLAAITLQGSMVLLVASAGCRSEPDVDSTATVRIVSPTNIEQARRLLSQGQHDQALALAQDALLASPENVDALRIVASVYAENRRYAEAAEIAKTLADLQIPDPSEELLRAFDWHLRGGDLNAAERDLSRAIAIAPDDPRGHRTMAQLLNAEGRRFEARRHVLALAKLGVITHHERMSLIDASGPFHLVSFGELLNTTSTGLFDLGKARHQYLSEGKLDEAQATMDRLVTVLPNSPAAAAFRGRLIVQKTDSDRFERWIRQLPAGTDEHPEYWLAVGTWLRNHDRNAEAVRAFGEALRLDPTDRQALRSISATLIRLGENEKAKAAQASLAVLDKIFRLASRADAEQAMWIGEQLQALSRPWESIGWYRHAFQLQRAPLNRIAELRQRQEQIRQWESKASLDQIRDARVYKMLGFDIREYPEPKLQSFVTPKSIVEHPTGNNRLQFRDIAESVGITTSFESGYSVSVPDFYLYQANGGGIAAFDYDLDGLCDLYFAQSGGDPNQEGTSVANQLFRQLPGERFVEIAELSLTGDRGFGQGVCAADVNQDGLPDLLIANIGRNVLYINQGDGTFRERSELIMDDAAQWTSSVAVADLDGDHLPEIVEVNYLDDPLIFKRMCRGKQLDCTPQRFRRARDRIYQTVGDGTFRDWPDAKAFDQLPNFGLGVVITDFDGQHGNDVFISNDGDLNHFWKSGPLNSAEPKKYGLTESAGIAGCSIGWSGDSQACMGIATGDFDHNGLIDLAITNFYDEPMNLFLQNTSGFFVDEAFKYGLVDPAQDMLGFGTQSADFDNDGWLDLAILNGHIYDARYAGIPFRMASQLMQGGPRGFSLQNADAGGPYWSREQLARTLAMLDWNRDGRMDLVANHLDQPIAVLQNESAAENWLQLELVGVISERSAIGARVVIHAGDQQWTAWRVAGDGYMCTNEPILHVGLGHAEQVDRIEIEWPSEAKQTLKSITTNRRYLVVEGEEQTVERTP